MKTFKFLLLLFICSTVLGQEAPDLYPTHWFTGMKNPNLQLMVHGKGIATKFPMLKLSPEGMAVAPGIRLKKITRVDNPNYVFLDLVIGNDARPGTYSFALPLADGSHLSYELKPRRTGKGTAFAQGITQKDFIYLIMPDRFSNGDPTNDRVPGLRDQSLNRDTIFERHGGDLKGVQNKLPYLQDLGVTAVWLTPVLENDMRNRTEHGYAFTNHYKVDPRLGGNAAYHSLVDDLHRRGMKIIQDAVYNHIGIEHFLYRDMPDSSWFHRWPKYTGTSYRDQTLFDPYAAPSDTKRMSDGWFVPSMPDINQSNQLFATYLIQHALWCTEEFGVDGWRIDTYIYNDLAFMNRCNKALLDEYPQLHLFGETWVHGVINQAFFTENKMDVSFHSNLPGATDFQTHLYGILPALNENPGWTEGVNRLYNTLAQDMVYKDPTRNVNFLDNHDKTRFFSEIGEDVSKFKMGIGWLLTTRGIPQLYYGTEVLMKGVSNPDGWVRLDFPGGWTGDKQNKFEQSGRIPTEDSAFNWTRTLARYRRTSPALTGGKLMQYLPEDGVYTFFRYTPAQTVMVVMNTNGGEKKLLPSRFAERTGGFITGKNVETGTSVRLGDNEWTIPARTIWILELQK